MPSCRKETVSKFSEEELLETVKQNLDEVGIAYEEKPGGFQIEGKWLDPTVDFTDESNLSIFERPDLYELAVRTAMAKMGATDADFNLLTEEAIQNNIRAHRSPEDLAWAIMQ